MTMEAIGDEAGIEYRCHDCVEGPSGKSQNGGREPFSGSKKPRYRENEGSQGVGVEGALGPNHFLAW